MSKPKTPARRQAERIANVVATRVWHEAESLAVAEVVRRRIHSAIQDETRWLEWQIRFAEDRGRARERRAERRRRKP